VLTRVALKPYHNISLHQGSSLTPLASRAAEGIKLAEADGVDWVFHVDTDELMYPASSAEYSLQVCPLTAWPAFEGA